MKSPAVRHLGYYATLVVVGLLCAAVINYEVDPAHLFSGDEYEKGIVNLLLSGNNVAAVSNYDEGKVQKYYVAGLSKAEEVIVLGSSRSMQIRSSVFPGRAFFNHSVSSASLGDILGTYELYRQRGYVPSIVVLGLDPWILSKNMGGINWTSLAEEYLAITQSLSLPITPGDLPEDTESKMKTLFSLPYCQTSLVKLLSGSGGYFPTKDADFGTHGILNDGAHLYGSKVRDRSINEVEELAVSHIKDYTYFYDSNAKPDQKSRDILIAFVDYLQRSGVRVIFYLPPYHPTTYRLLSESAKYSVILRAEEIFRDIAANRGIPVAGGYNPRNSFSTNEEFYDAWHPKVSSVMKSFANIE